MIVGEAEIAVLAKDRNFQGDLKRVTAPAFSYAEQEALRTGEKMGENLGVGVGGAGPKLAAEGEKAGRELGTGLERGVKASTGALAAEGEAAGLSAGRGVERGAKSGLSGLEAGLTSAVTPAMNGVKGKFEDGEKEVESKSRGFSQRLASAFQSLGTKLGSWGVPFSGSITKMGQDIEKGERAGKGFTSTMTQIGKGATILGATLALAIGVASVKAAESFEKAQSTLQVAVRNSGSSFHAIQPQIDGANKRLMDLGFTSTETEGALTKLVTSTKNPAKALEELGTAANLARFRHIGLIQASETLARVNAGAGSRALLQLGINLNVGSSKMATMQKSAEALTKAQKGLQAAEQGVAAAQQKASELRKQAEERVAAAQEHVKQAQDQLRSDTEAVAASQEKLKEAQAHVTEQANKQRDAIRGATLALKEAEAEVRKVEQEGAKEVAQAKEHVKSVEAEQAKEIRDNNIKTIESEEQKLAATKTATSEAEIAKLKARRSELEGMDAAEAAAQKEKTLTEARRGVGEAETKAHEHTKTALDKVTKAHEALVKAQKEALASSKANVQAAKAVEAAQNGVGQAEQKLAKDHANVAKAQREVVKAQEAVAGSSDVVTKAQEKLKAAHEAVAKAEETQKKNSSATSKIMDALNEKLKGVAQTYSKTLAGSIDVAKAKFDELGVSIGQHLIPILLRAGTVLMSVIGFFIHGSVVAHVLEVAIGGPLVAAMLMYIGTLVKSVAVSAAGFAKMLAGGAMWAARMALAFAQTAAGWIATGAEAVASAVIQAASWAAVAAAATAAFIAENLATLGIIAALAAVVAGIVYLATHWKQVWGEITKVIGAAVSFVTKHLGLVEAALVVLLGPLGLLIAAGIALATHWKQVWAAVVKIVHDAAHALTGAWHSVESGVVNLWNKVEHWVASGVKNVVHWFVSMGNSIIKLFNEIVKAAENFGIKLVEGIVNGIEKDAGAIGKAITKAIPGGKLIGDAAKVLGLAEGGIVHTPTLAVVGEKGPEAVIPLKDLHTDRAGMSSLPGKQAAKAAPVPSSSGNLQMRDFIVHGPNLSPSDVLKEFSWGLRSGQLALAGAAG